VPKVLVNLDFDAGFSSDTAATQGTQSLMLALLDEGTDAAGGSRTSTQIAEEQERLGAAIAAEGVLDFSAVRLSALTTNLAPSLALMADVVRHPAFAPADVARVKAQRLAEIAENAASPVGMVRAVIGPIAYGSAHPYGISQTGLGTTATVSELDPAALRAAHDTWFRPDLATISVVGDTTLAQLVPLLEAAFGGWRSPATPTPHKDLSAPVPAPRSRIVVIDRPNSPQSVIASVRVLKVTGGESQYALDLANGVLGGDFLSRLNQDLREEKGWSYGVSSQVGRPKGPRMLTVIAPVQADKTGASIAALIADMKAFPATKGTAPEELARVTEGNIRALPGEFETNGQLLTGIVNNRRLGRPEAYYTQLASHYRAVDAKAIDAAAAQYLQPEGLVTLVVGDRKVIDPQLQALGLPIEYMAIDKPVGNN
jgi:predicted Zn-dependent peptidase